ncbi:hypothetical protein FOZ63_013974, partial [Perkinsus olseni]
QKGELLSQPVTLSPWMHSYYRLDRAIGVNNDRPNDACYGSRPPLHPRAVNHAIMIAQGAQLVCNMRRHFTWYDLRTALEFADGHRSAYVITTDSPTIRSLQQGRSIDPFAQGTHPPTQT